MRLAIIGFGSGSEQNVPAVPALLRFRAESASSGSPGSVSGVCILEEYLRMSDAAECPQHCSPSLSAAKIGEVSLIITLRHMYVCMYVCITFMSDPHTNNVAIIAQNPYPRLLI